MRKRTIRILLLLLAVVLAVNLIFFSYGPWLLLPLLEALGLLALTAGVGFFIAWRLGITAVGMLEAMGLGLIASTAYFYLVASLGILNGVSVTAFFVTALALVAYLASGRERRRESQAVLKRFFSRPLAEYAAFVIPLFYAALPPSFYDSLVYHLGIPNLYLHNGGFVATPQFMFANTFIYYEIAMIPAVFLGDLVPRLFHFLLGAFFVLSVADEACENWGVKKRIDLILAVVSLPMTLFLLVTCKNDLSSAIFVFLAVRQQLRHHRVLSAVFWGFAVGIKYFNLLPLALFLLLTGKPWTRDGLKRMVLTGLIVFLLVSPLLVKNVRFSGNPFFPFFQKAFPSATWDGDRQLRLQAEVGRIVRTPADFFKLPYNLSFFSHGYGGLVGPLFLIFLPFLVLAPFVQKKWLMWALLLLAIAPFFTASIRFVYVAFVVLAIFSLQAYEAVGGAVAKTIFYLLLVINFVMGLAMLEKFYLAHTMLSGKFSDRQYREHFFPAYPAFAHINETAPAGARVLIAGEARNFYLKRPYQVSSAMDYCILRKYLAPSLSAGDFVAAMRRDGFSYLLVNLGEMQRLKKSYAIMTGAEHDKLTFFLASLQPEFHQGSVRLYHIGAP